MRPTSRYNIDSSVGSRIGGLGMGAVDMRVPVGAELFDDWVDLATRSSQKLPYHSFINPSTNRQEQSLLLLVERHYLF